MSAFERTLKQHLVSYRIVSQSCQRNVTDLEGSLVTSSRPPGRPQKRPDDRTWNAGVAVRTADGSRRTVCLEYCNAVLPLRRTAHSLRHAAWSTRTSDAAVVDLEIALELLVARSNAVERGLDDLDGAGASARAAPVQQVQHVRETAHEAEVGLDAATEPHPTVQSRRHQDDLCQSINQSINRWFICFSNKAVVDRRLRPRCCHLRSYFKLPKISPVRPLACNWHYCVQLIAKPKAACALRFGWAATLSNLGLWANMTSSIKPEVHNVSLRRQMRTEPWP